VWRGGVDGNYPLPTPSDCCCLSCLPLRLLLGGANQFPGGFNSRCGPSPFHGALGNPNLTLDSGSAKQLRLHPLYGVHFVGHDFYCAVSNSRAPITRTPGTNLVFSK
jgi:hypothetical protein